MIVQHEGIDVLIIDRVVFAAIIVIIAIFVHLQKALYIGIAGLAVRLHFRVEQIGQGLVAIRCGEGCIRRDGQIQLGIAVVAQVGFYDAFIGLLVSGPFIPLPDLVSVLPHPVTEE